MHSNQLHAQQHIAAIIVVNFSAWACCYVVAPHLKQYPSTLHAWPKIYFWQHVPRHLAVMRSLAHNGLKCRRHCLFTLHHEDTSGCACTWYRQVRLSTY